MNSTYYVRSCLGSFVRVSRDTFNEFIFLLGSYDPEYLCREKDEYIGSIPVSVREFHSGGDLVGLIYREVSE